MDGWPTGRWPREELFLIQLEILSTIFLLLLLLLLPSSSSPKT